MILLLKGAQPTTFANSRAKINQGQLFRVQDSNEHTRSVIM